MRKRSRAAAWSASLSAALIVSGAGAAFPEDDARAQAKAAPPKKAEVQALLKQAAPDGKPRVSTILGDAGGGRFPVLFVTVGRDCNKTPGGSDNCSPTTLPHLAVVTRGADGKLALGGTLALPRKAAPWDVVEPLKWGVSSVKDYDRDGKPELFVIYGYHGPMQAGLGDVYYREWALLNLEPAPSVALHVTLDEKPQASTLESVESKYKLPPPGAAVPEIAVTRTVGTYVEGKDDRATRQEQVVYRYDAKKDQWAAAPVAQPARPNRR